MKKTTISISSHGLAFKNEHGTSFIVSPNGEDGDVQHFTVTCEVCGITSGLVYSGKIEDGRWHIGALPLLLSTNEFFTTHQNCA